MSHWNHRLVKQTFKDGSDWYSVREVFYNGDEDDDNNIFGYTEDPVDISGESVEEIREYLKWCLKCLDKPILVDGQVKFARDDVPEEDIREMKNEGLSDDEIDFFRN